MKKPLARLAALLLLTPLITTAQITPPYSTGFESADGFTLGPVTSGDWDSNSAEIIHTDTALGDQALQLGWHNEQVPELNLSIDSTGNIHFVDLHLKPVAGNIDDLPSEFTGTLIGLTALIKDDNLGEIYITHGTGAGSGTWQPTGITLPLTGKTSTDWVRYTYRYNHSAKKWDLYINSQLSAYNIGYIDNSVSALNDFTIFGDTRKSTRLDHYSISTTNPLFDDADSDGIDDDYETLHGLNTSLDDRESDKDHDWLSNLNEYFQGLSAGNPDTDGDGVSDGRELAQETDPLVADEFDLSTLPFTEDFESYTLGTGIHGQNHWQITGSLAPIVQNSIVQQGSKALQIQGNGTPITIANQYNGSAQQSIWIDLHSKPRRSTHIPELNPTATAAFYFDNDGQLRVKNGNYWNLVIDSQPLEPGAWVRIALHINYTTQQWAIWLDGVLTAHELGFHHTNPYLSQIQIDHNGYHTSYLDNIAISDQMPEYLQVPLPEELDQELEIWEDTALAVHLEQLSNSYPAIEYVIVETPDHGTLIGEGAERTYIPDLNYHGADSFTYKIVRGEEQTETGTIDIQVQPINDAPWVNAGVSQSIVLPATASLDGTVTDVDSSGFDYRWRKVSGPGDVTFADYQDLDTTATFSAAGDYILRLNVDDNIDLRSDTVAIHVAAASSTLPTVSLTAPSNNATFGSPATINLTATASTGSGTVTKVEFFEGTRKLGEDTSSPYVYAWTPVNYGAYALTAVVTDSNGLKAVSTTHTVKVTITKPAELGGGTITPGAPGNNGAPSIGGGDGSGIPGDPEGNGFLSSILENTQGQEPPYGNGSSGYHIDQDDDGLSDLEEEELGTDKHNEDTDNDGTNDSEDGWPNEPKLAPERIPVTKYAVVEVDEFETEGFQNSVWSVFLNDNVQLTYTHFKVDESDDSYTTIPYFWENGSSQVIENVAPGEWPIEDYTLNSNDIGMTALYGESHPFVVGLDNAGTVYGMESIAFDFYPTPDGPYSAYWGSWAGGDFLMSWTSSEGGEFIIDPPSYDPDADSINGDRPDCSGLPYISGVNGDGSYIGLINDNDYKEGIINDEGLLDYYEYISNEPDPPTVHDAYVMWPSYINNSGDIVGSKIWGATLNANPTGTPLLKKGGTYLDLSGSWGFCGITDRDENDEFQILGAEGSPGDDLSTGFWLVKGSGIETVSAPSEMGGPVAINNRLQVISNQYEDEESNVIEEAGIWQNYKRYNIADLVSDDRYSGFALHTINNNGVIAATASFQAEDENGDPDGDPVDKIVLLVPVEVKVDANRDGEMSFTDGIINDRDKTTEENPYVFWVNDDNDSSDEDHPGSSTKDCSNNTIEGKRDLEDFTRLWINFKGITNFVKTSGASLKLEWKNTEGNPGIKVYKSTENDGGTEYLKEEEVAEDQIESPYGTAYGLVSGSSSLTFELPTGTLSNLSEENPEVYCLFEGASEGKGQLILTVESGDTEIKYPPLYLELRSVRKMYQDVIATPESGFQSPAKNSSAKPVYPNFNWTSNEDFEPDLKEKNSAVIFIHGWRMLPAESRNFAETMFKRMWQKGFYGRFCYFRWPTLVDDYSFSESELRAWKYGKSLQMFISALPANYSRNLIAHSLGNVVVAGAIDRGVRPDSYIAMQAAIPAGCYDISETINNDPLFEGVVTPDLTNPDKGYRGYVSDAGVSVVNFYNEVDFALVTGSMFTFNTNWKTWQRNHKPRTYSLGSSWDGLLVYKYQADEPSGQRLSLHRERPILAYDDELLRFINDKEESVALIARPRSTALGAISITQNSSQSYDLQQSEFGSFSNSQSDHSGQFNRRIQELENFYQTILDEIK